MMKQLRLSDETYWLLRDVRDRRAKDLKRQVTFDELIKHLIEGE